MGVLDISGNVLRVLRASQARIAHGIPDRVGPPRGLWSRLSLCRSPIGVGVAVDSPHEGKWPAFRTVAFAATRVPIFHAHDQSDRCNGLRCRQDGVRQAMPGGGDQRKSARRGRSRPGVPPSIVVDRAERRSDESGPNRAPRRPREDPRLRPQGRRGGAVHHRRILASLARAAQGSVRARMPADGGGGHRIGGASIQAGAGRPGAGGRVPRPGHLAIPRPRRRGSGAERGLSPMPAALLPKLGDADVQGEAHRLAGGTAEIPGLSHRAHQSDHRPTVPVRAQCRGAWRTLGGRISGDGADF